MVLEITHLVGSALFFLTMPKQQSLTVFYVEVTSGVLRRSVLGQMLFVLYINDINHAITSQIKRFADDSVLHRNICNQHDQVILQNDLDIIY